MCELLWNCIEVKIIMPKKNQQVVESEVTQDGGESSGHDLGNDSQRIELVAHPHGSVKMRKYDGKSCWRIYRKQFERVLLMNGWQHHPLDYLWIHLEEEALSFAEGLQDSECLSYDQLCSELEYRFGAERIASVHKAELLSRRRKNGESLAELGQSIRTLVTYAYPKLTGDAKEELIIEKFLDALPSSELRKNIYQSNPQKLNDAIECGLKVEAWNLVEDKKHGKTHLRMVGEEELQPETESVRIMKGLQKQIEELKVSERREKDIVCYYCGRKGHFARDCRSRQKDEKEKEERSQRPQKGTKKTCFKCGGRGHQARECPSPSENE